MSQVTRGEGVHALIRSDSAVTRAGRGERCSSRMMRTFPQDPRVPLRTGEAASASSNGLDVGLNQPSHGRSLVTAESTGPCGTRLRNRFFRARCPALCRLCLTCLSLLIHGPQSQQQGEAIPRPLPHAVTAHRASSPGSKWREG